MKTTLTCFNNIDYIINIIKVTDLEQKSCCSPVLVTRGLILIFTIFFKTFKYIYNLEIYIYYLEIYICIFFNIFIRTK